ncbi:hypothetical protein LPJ61_004164 [Coemansia biformis]|uniref:Uncharacterized protein n=1 Tax=Coemansia biformis TaxID=1286918 RepID=A0A9W7Y5B7_9FUNG|nr:hypothetical protein LPJ61_004164 [Coemansia biformis]
MHKQSQSLMPEAAAIVVRAHALKALESAITLVHSSAPGRPQAAADAEADVAQWAERSRAQVESILNDSAPPSADNGTEVEQQKLQQILWRMAGLRHTDGRCEPVSRSFAPGLGATAVAIEMCLVILQSERALPAPGAHVKRLSKRCAAERLLNSRVECLLEESLGLFEQYLQDRSDQQCADTLLFPLLQTLTPTPPLLRSQACRALMVLAQTTQAVSIATMLRANVDYIVKGCSRQIRSVALHPHVFEVLMGAVRLVGRDILLYMDDVVEATLDSCDVVEMVCALELTRMCQRMRGNPWVHFLRILSGAVVLQWGLEVEAARRVLGAMATVVRCVPLNDGTAWGLVVSVVLFFGHLVLEPPLVDLLQAMMPLYADKIWLELAKLRSANVVPTDMPAFVLPVLA